MLGELQPGDPQQAGPYRLLGRLGNGGMGQVFLGRSAGGRPVAVKVIRAELAGDVDFRARFRQEVAAARKVSGLFTALVVDADVDGQMPWLATAYVAGPSLAEAVASHGNLSAETVLALAASLAEGLHAIHAAGVVHRDLKPSNVLLADDGPRVIDFGISRAAEASALTHTGSVVGSPGFMSPEQAEGGEVGPPSDMFSLGAVLTFAATGEGPFGTGATVALMYRVVHGEPSLENVPAGVRPLVERCLAKDPGDRPTAGELLAELSGTALAADWLPEQIVRDLPRYAVSGADSGGAADTGDSPGQGADESAPAPAVRERTVTAAAASPSPGQTTGPPLPHGVTWFRQRGLVVASVAVGLAASAVAIYALLGTPASGHPKLSAGQATAASTALAASRAATSPAPASQVAASDAAASHVPASRRAGASPRRSPSGRASGSAGATTAGPPSQGNPASQGGSGNAPGAQDAPAAAVAASVSSAYAPLDGYVYVAYQNGTDSNAAVSGQVANAVSGEVARLYAQQFPFTRAPAPVGSAALDPSGTTAQYSFQVTPTLATRYTVEVFRDSTATVPLTTSGASTVYVVQTKGNDSTIHCSGSQCQLTDTATVLVPASALSTQMAARDYPYFGISYAASGTAPAPATLQLGGGDAVVGPPQQVSADEYRFTLTFSYSTNNEHTTETWHNCTVSLEAQDGIGLPGGGDYGCGSPTIPGTEPYLG
jgi:eukaryotic-like serine/threonine-protein kinase